MCLILFAWHARPDIPLLVAANRDEDFMRPAAAAAFWTDRPGLLAGRDLGAGGTWLGITQTGRFAAITNFRNPASRRENAPSRGALVADYLAGDVPPAAYLEYHRQTGAKYNGFSLLVGDEQELWFYSNRGDQPQRIEPGVHGLSNHLLDTPWPKVVKGVRALETRIGARFDAEEHFSILADTEPASPDALPDTGVGPERERWLSSMRIVGGGYGTRCSTVLRVDAAGGAEFHERTWSPDGQPVSTVSHQFKIIRS